MQTHVIGNKYGVNENSMTMRKNSHTDEKKVSAYETRSFK